MKCKATSFGDINDVKRFNQCKQRGGTDQQCFRIGDNGRGAWGAVTAQDVKCMVAVTPDDLFIEFGSSWRKLACNEPVHITCPRTGRSCVAYVQDIMPHLDHITNGARLDMNPATCIELGLSGEVYEDVEWRFMS